LWEDAKIAWEAEIDQYRDVIFVLENGKILYNLGQNEEFKRSIDRLKTQAGTIYEI
jgi:hypothetical protein